MRNTFLSIHGRLVSMSINCRWERKQYCIQHQSEGILGHVKLQTVKKHVLSICHCKT